MLAPPCTLSQAVTEATARLRHAGVEEPRREAQLLLGHTLGITRGALLAHLADEVPPRAAAEFRAYVARRAAREPLAYITGKRVWRDITLQVTRTVLIPRPETELLADLAIHEIARRVGGSAPAPVVVDVGTGSGALAIALARSSAAAQVIGTDIRPAALRVARKNSLHLARPGQILYVHADLLPPEPELFDLIVSNPPYIPRGDLPWLPPEVQFEPVEALDGGHDGLACIRELYRVAARRLFRGGSVLVECGHDQAETVKTLAAAYWPDAEIAVHRDYAEIARFVRVRRS
jgi:release factor glutamine methyltransferase